MRKSCRRGVGRCCRERLEGGGSRRLQKPPLERDVKEVTPGRESDFY